MKWLKIDLNNLPKGEVLAANFKEDTYGYEEKILGSIYVSDEGVLTAESENEVLENVSHYIAIHDFDLSREE